MTQADLSFQLGRVWEQRTGENRPFDAVWVDHLEAGLILVSLILARCVAQALDANRNETQLLLQAAGYNGAAVMVLEEWGIDMLDFEVRVAICVRELAQGTIPLNEVLRLMEMQRFAVSKELTRRLRSVAQ